MQQKKTKKNSGLLAFQSGELKWKKKGDKEGNKKGFYNDDHVGKKIQKSSLLLEVQTFEDEDDKKNVLETVNEQWNWKRMVAKEIRKILSGIDSVW